MKRRKLTFFLMIPLFLLIMFFTFIEIRVRPLVIEFASSRARQLATDMITAAAEPILDEADSYVTVSGSDLGVSSVQLDSRRVASLRVDAVDAIAARLAESSEQQIVVPLFNLTGSTLASGIGIPVTVRILPVGDILADVRTDFVESGINQTLHTVSLRVRVSLSLLVAREVIELDITSDIPLAQTVIVGVVPDAYTAINRYEIDESEENDLNDYAASIP